MALTPVLSLKDVGLDFRRRGRGFSRHDLFTVLDDISFDLYPGETLGIIGRNAAGKSTLLRLIAGILKPDRGSIVRSARRISLLSLQTGFVPYLTGRENATLSGILLGLTRREVERRMSAIVAFSELGEFIDQPLHTYSSGMRARLGFAVAYQVEPEVLLIDEVLSVGDEAFQKKSRTAMRSRMESNGTFVLVSHSVPTVRQLCNRVVWLDGGRVRGVGPVETVVPAYQRVSATCNTGNNLLRGTKAPISER